MSNIPKWLQSSQNSEKVSLTIKSVGASLVAFLPLLTLLGIPLTEVDLETLVEVLSTASDNFFVVVNQIFILISSILAFYGLLRKLWKPKKT